MVKIKQPIFFKFIIVISVVLFLQLRFEVIAQPKHNLTYRYSDKKLTSLFKNEDIKPTIKSLNFEDKNLRYMELITEKDQPFVIFIHGSPGSSADYIAYFRDESLYNKVNLISIDRMGYGYSDFGNSQTSIQYQAKAIFSIIQACCSNKRVILVGQSFGGTIAVRIAMDYPGTFSSLLLLAPALDPENKQKIKLANLAVNAPTSWITPKALKVAANEKLKHSAELKEMVPLYNRIKISVYHFHGNKDSLVPYENIDFSKGHFLPRSQKELITQKIIEVAANH